MPMGFSESVMTAVFIMLVVFTVLVVLWGLIRAFTGIVASVSGLGGRAAEGKSARSRRDS